MKVLYIGEPKTHNLYLKGKVPSHWLYGACEMEKDGHNVVWEEEKSNFLNDILLCIKHNPNLIFIPNLNIHSHIFLLALSALHLFNTPIFAYLHHGPSTVSRLKNIILSFLFKGLKHLFFLSEKTMSETIKAGFISQEKCSDPGWGPDRLFYGKIKVRDNGYFISTGKENRDFETLIAAFERTGAPLLIITAETHGNHNYTNLYERCKNISNINVKIVKNSGEEYPQILSAMADAKAIVCPLLRNKLTYCVGLSTIADAEGLQKPLIITENPYHNKVRLSKYKSVVSVGDWVSAIEEIQFANNNIDTADTQFSMQSAYIKMKNILFK